MKFQLLGTYKEAFAQTLYVNKFFDCILYITFDLVECVGLAGPHYEYEDLVGVRDEIPQIPPNSAVLSSKIFRTITRNYANRK
jgi:hypothetical protein